MKKQLRLMVPFEGEWEIDEEARRIGVDGVAAARVVLANTRPPAPRLDQAQQPDLPPNPPVQGKFPFPWHTESGDPF